MAGPWYTNGWNLKNTPVDADFTIAELESEDDYNGILASEPETRLFPRAVVTNFTFLSDANGVPQPQRSKPLIDAGFFCLPECDTRVNPNATIENQVFFAQQLGWLVPQPVVYCQRESGWGLEKYPTRTQHAGWSVYLGGAVL